MKSTAKILPTLEELESISRRKQKEFDEHVEALTRLKEQQARNVVPEILALLIRETETLQKKGTLRVYQWWYDNPDNPSCRLVKEYLDAELSRQGVTYLETYMVRDDSELFVKIKDGSPALFNQYLT